jgi:hypothetical protein
MAMEADVVASGPGPGNAEKKHVATVKWTAGKATVGMGMGQGMYGWIKQSFDKGTEPKNGRLISGDVNYKAQSALDFEGALITEVAVPKLDGSSKDAAYFDITFEAERVRWSKAQGGDIRAKLGPKEKAWLRSNFRVELGNLPCSRIASVGLVHLDVRDRGRSNRYLPRADQAAGEGHGPRPRVDYLDG